MEWIKTSERLPDFDTDVLILCNNGIGIAQLQNDIEWKANFDMVDGYDISSDIYDVTDWMPLPEPPKDNE